MRIQAKSALLLRQALQKSAKCIDSKASMAILSNVLLTRREGDGQFLFVSGNTDSQLTVPAPFEIIEGNWQKDIVLPIAMLSSFIGTLPSDCVLTFSISETSNAFTIKYCTGSGSNVKEGKVDLTYENAEDFPKAKVIGDDALHICLPMSFFKPMLASASKFVGHDELRPVMNTICIDVAEDLSQVVFVASDGNKLYKHIHTNDPEDDGSEFYREGKAAKILVSCTYFKTLAVFDDCEDIDIQTDGHVVRLASGDIEFIGTLVEGNYPNYNSVIPRNAPYHITCNKKEFLEIIKRISLFSSESSKLVVLKKDGMFLNVSAQDIDFSFAGEDQVLINDSECPEDFRIGFSWVSLQDSLSAIPSENITLHLADSTRVGTVTSDDPSGKVLTLAMPMLLND